MTGFTSRTSDVLDQLASSATAIDLGTNRSVSVAELFAVFVSPLAATTVAELTRSPVAAVPTLATIVNTALPLAASVILVSRSPVPEVVPVAPPV